MQKLVWLNGKVSPLEDAVTSVADHAHLYGDGLFEGIRIYGGRIFKLDEHLDRLYCGVHYLKFEMEMLQSELRAVVIEVCQMAEIENGYIRLNVTRGTGLGLDPKNINRKPNVMVMVSTLALYPAEAYETGLKVITTSFRVIPADALDPKVKCIGRYAGNILAKMEANRQGAGEGMMLNHQGYVAECTGDNLFIIKNGKIRTPHPSSGILMGITRQTVIDLARAAGYDVVEDLITPYDLFACDEAFLTGTAAEVIGMVSLDSQNIGDGKPGTHTRRIMQMFREHTETGVPFKTPQVATI